MPALSLSKGEGDILVRIKPGRCLNRPGFCFDIRDSGFPAQASAGMIPARPLPTLGSVVKLSNQTRHSLISVIPAKAGIQGFT